MLKPKNRVLIVAFHYPPDLSSSGVLRTLKFSRYLPENGWLPTVLTVRPHFYETTDGALEQQIPESVEVWRTRAVDMKRTFSIAGKHLRMMVVPDRFVGWIPFALLSGRKLIRKHNFDAIYSTSPVPSAHLVAMALHRLTRIPWAADFRDPWLEPELVDVTRPLYRFEEALERRVLKSATRLIFTTAQLRDYMLRGRDELGSKSAVIPNGYDELDFTTTPDKPGAGAIVITHAGLLDGSYRSPRGVLEALAELISKGEFSHHDIRLKLLGPGDYPETKDFRLLLDRLGLREVVVIKPKVSYSECLAEQAQSHILLLLQCGEDTRTLIPAKAFEYLKVGRPVLAITPEGATSELFARTGGAWVAHPNDQGRIQEGLRSLVQSVRRDSMARAKIDFNALESYSRRNLTRELAKHMTSMVAGNQSVLP